jgi:hypothetical protein
MTNLIATKVGLTSNNTISGSNTFSNLPYYVNTQDQLINKNYVDGRFTTLLSANNTFTGSNTFNSSSGNIIDRLFSTILSVNNGNSRRNVANYFEVGMGATSPYIYYDNSGKFGSVNTNDSSLNWNIALNSVFTIKTINSTTENVGTLNVSTDLTFATLPNFVNTTDKLINKAYVDTRFTNLLSANNTFSGSNTFSNDTSGNIINRLFTNILAINNNNTRRSTNDIFEVATSSTGNYIYYNNSSTFGFINTSNSTLSWFINSSGAATIPSITTSSGTITTLTSTTGSITNL